MNPIRRERVSTHNQVHDCFRKDFVKCGLLQTFVKWVTFEQVGCDYCADLSCWSVCISINNRYPNCLIRKMI